MKRIPVLKMLMVEYLREHKKLNGYAFRKYCEEQNIKVSNGTIYPHIQELTRKKIIKPKRDGKKIVYTFTLKGRLVIKRLVPRIPKSLKSDMIQLVYKGPRMNWNKKEDLQEFHKHLKNVEKELVKLIKKK